MKYNSYEYREKMESYKFDFTTLLTTLLFNMFWFGELHGCPEFLFKCVYCMHQTIVYLDYHMLLCLQSVLDIVQIRLSVDKRRNYMI